jgi:hypothetical protein
MGGWWPVDVDQLSRPLTLVAHSGLQADTSELAHPDPLKDSRHGPKRHIEDLGDLRTGEP